MMFGLLSNLYKYLKRKSEKNLTFCIIGLDNAGKTTLLNDLVGDDPSMTVPTFGFNNEYMKLKQHTINFFDLGGGESIRKIWTEYFAEVHGAIYVVDSAETSRFEESRQELFSNIVDEMLNGKPLLIFANKQDLPNSKSAAEVALGLQLNTITQSRYHVTHCTALMPDGKMDSAITDGLNWLVSAVEEDYEQLSERVKVETVKLKQRQAEELRLKQERVQKRKEERKKEAEKMEHDIQPTSQLPSTETQNTPTTTFNTMVLGEAEEGGSTPDHVPRIPTLPKDPGTVRSVQLVVESGERTPGNDEEGQNTSQEINNMSSQNVEGKSFSLTKTISGSLNQERPSLEIVSTLDPTNDSRDDSPLNSDLPNAVPEDVI